ncbi:MAG: hypothetical protein JJW00_02420 [Sulfurimonas sp.]|nr:hypothetical protein [Sulfurimonas sp.]
MKKILLLTVLLPIAMFAKSFLISNIPLPKTYIQNLDPYPCSETCLQEYLDNGMIFSFLSHAQSKLTNKEQDERRMMNISVLNIGSQIINDKLHIALLLPYKIIGRYASSTTNASFAYLISKNHSFELKSYKIKSESLADIKEALQQIDDDGFSYVIAPLTHKGANNVAKLNPQINIFFPTINKTDVTSTSSYLTYGGIDYKAQSDLLLKEAVSPLVIFYDHSKIGRSLSIYQKDKFINSAAIKKTKNSNRSVLKFSIPKRTTNLQKYLSKNKKIQKASFIINTPIVKTGMIMSQLTLYDTNATNVLSTQINYDPLILSITQHQDRKNMLIANSITDNNNVFIESNSLLGNDIVYDWINYTTTVGVDYFFSLATRESREYLTTIKDNQMIYPIELLSPARYRFVKYRSLKE